MNQFAELTPEEARALGGGFGLTPPSEGVTIKEITYDKGKPTERRVEQSTWKEVAILDTIEPQEIKPGRFDGYPQDVREPEVWMAKWHIPVDSETNGGRKVADFMEFVWDLATVGRETLEDYAKKYKGTSEVKQFWQTRFFDLSSNVRKMANILRLAGHTDRLPGGYFMGFGTCFDILPTVRGTKYLITIEQQEDKKGNPRAKVTKVEEYKG